MSEETIGRHPMALAMDAARAAGAAGEVPVGAVILRDGVVIATAGNRTIRDRDPTAHAEVVAIRQAARVLGNHRLVDCELHVTLEPCAMCAGAISFARIRRLSWGCDDPKGGAVVNGPRFFAQPTCHHAPEVLAGGAQAADASALLRDFFATRRRRGGATISEQSDRKREPLVDRSTPAVLLAPDEGL